MGKFDRLTLIIGHFDLVNVTSHLLSFLFFLVKRRKAAFGENGSRGLNICRLSGKFLVPSFNRKIHNACANSVFHRVYVCVRKQCRSNWWALLDKQIQPRNLHLHLAPCQWNSSKEFWWPVTIPPLSSNWTSRLLSFCRAKRHTDALCMQHETSSNNVWRRGVKIESVHTWWKNNSN